MKIYSNQNLVIERSFLEKYLIKNDVDFSKECGFLMSDISRLNLEFKNILLEQNEEHLDYIKNEEESIFERILSKKMEKDVNHLSLKMTIFEQLNGK